MTETNIINMVKSTLKTTNIIALIAMESNERKNAVGVTLAQRPKEARVSVYEYAIFTECL